MIENVSAHYENDGPLVFLNDIRYQDGSIDLEHVLENVIDATYEYTQNEITLRISQTSRRDIHQFVNRLRDIGVSQLHLDTSSWMPFLVHAHHGEMTHHEMVHDDQAGLCYHEITLTFDDMNLCDKEDTSVELVDEPKRIDQPEVRRGHLRLVHG